MPEGTKKKKPTGKQVETQKVRGKKAARKDRKALVASDAVSSAYYEALTNGEKTDMTLAQVTAILGAGRFRANNLVTKTNDVVKVAKQLSSKKAGYKNSTLPTAVHVDSYVILDVANTIKSVVGEADALVLRELLNVPIPKNDDDVFNRKGNKPKGNSKKAKKSKEGGGWSFW